MGEVRDIFTGEVVNPFEINTELAEYLTPSLIKLSSDFGVPDEILGIYATHLSKLHVVMSGKLDKNPSRISLFRSNERDEYRRLAIINPFEIARKSNLMRAEAKCYDLKIGKQRGDILGVEWAFFELAGDALSNSVYMQNRFERYIHETNVQDGFDSHLYVAKEFMEQYSDGFTRLDLVEQQTAFKRGLSLELMPDEFVKRGVTDNLKKAEWLVNALRIKYPKPINPLDIGHGDVTPLSTEELVARLGLITVRPALKEAFDYSSRLPLFEDEEDEEDYDDTPSSGIVYPIGR